MPEDRRYPRLSPVSKAAGARAARRARAGGVAKTRRFGAYLLAAVHAGGFGPELGGAGGSGTRPALAVLASSRAGLRATVANIREGRQFELGGDRRRFEWLVSQGWDVLAEPCERGAQATIAHRVLCALQPTGLEDPARVAFIQANPAWWVAARVAELRARGEAATAALLREVRAFALDPLLGARAGGVGDEELLHLVPVALRFCAYADRRDGTPLLAGEAWAVRYLLAALDTGVAHLGWRREADAPWAWARSARPVDQEEGAVAPRFLPGAADLLLPTIFVRTTPGDLGQTLAATAREGTAWLRGRR